MGGIVAVIFACSVALVLIGCATSPEHQAEQAALREDTTDCLVRESRAVAPQPIDLETAALAVLARCDYPGVIERSLVAEHPGMRDVIHSMVQARYDETKETAKKGIAMLRTKGAPKQ